MASARDLGVQGTTFPVAEPDLRAVILDQLAGADLEPMQDQMRKSGRSYAGRLKQWNFPRATQTQTRYFKPEFKVQRPVPVPQLKNGEFEWIEMGQRGQVINMRDYVTPHTAFLVIDARDHAQRKLAQELLEQEPFRIVVTLSSGNPRDVGRDLGHPVFHVTEWMTDFFRIEATPSLLYAAKGQHAREMGVTRFAPPYRPDTVLQAWEGVAS